MVSVVEAGSSEREMMLGLSGWQQPFSAA